MMRGIMEAARMKILRRNAESLILVCKARDTRANIRISEGRCSDYSNGGASIYDYGVRRSSFSALSLWYRNA